MPIIFIHGVNTRYDAAYNIDVAARRELIRRIIVEPLAANEKSFSELDTYNPYWGDLGASFRWNMESFPKLPLLASLGPKESVGANDPTDFIEVLEDLTLNPGEPVLQGRLDIEPGTLQRAAKSDPVRFIEAVLLPLIRSERLLPVPEDSPEAAGILEAQLLIAADKAANDPGVRASLEAAESDEQALRILRQSLLRNYSELYSGSLEGPRPETRALGPSWLTNLADYVGELFQRAEHAPKRLLTYSIARAKRRQLHDQFSLFFGDVFVYLKDRGTPSQPGPIISRLKQGILDAVQAKPTEPVIVITHSMGGNIFYDLATSFMPEIKVDFWFSVGGQVGQFEEMKLFYASDPRIVGPNRVSTLKPRVAHWHNIYDPADPVSFLVQPIFADAEDHPYVTGANVLASHGDYFKRPSFYRLLRSLIETDLRRDGRYPGWAAVMPSIEDIKRAMASTTGLDPDDFSYVTDELIRKRAESSRPLGQHPNAQVMLAGTGTYQGNHFVANGFSWSWEDSPGGCGRTQSWTHTAQSGDSYRSIGRCPQGYRLFEISII
jgi:hypothetical protein